ncbi:MAG: NTP transferase domain-containing protein [Chloroflexi bacterium]|nr:NTP transferase domain-containing protein [Chloroflexota bacterium]
METAVILAQGEGTKIWPFNSTRPKAAIPIGGKELLRHQIESLRRAGVSRILIVANSRFAPRLRHLASGVGSQPLGAVGIREADIPPVAEAKIDVLVLDPPRGTAPALQRALESLEDRYILALYGDVLLDPATLPNLLAAHRESPETSLALVVPLDQLEDLTIHLAVRVKDSQVEEVIAHPRHSVTHRLAGAFAFDRQQVLPYLQAHPGYVPSIPSGGMPPQDEADLAQTLQMMVEDGLTVRTVEPAAFALDIDRPWDILIANYVWLEFLGKALTQDHIHPTAHVSERADVNGHLVVGEGATIGPGVVLRGNAWVERNAEVTSGAIVGANTYIGPRTSVRDYAYLGDHTSIGPRCKVGHCAEVHGVVFGRSSIVHYCELWGVLGEAVDVGAATVYGTLRFDDRPASHRIKGRWETPRFASDATFIGDFCRTGVNVIFMPGSKVGAYSAIGPGVVVNGDVPERSLLLLKQEVIRKDWGPEKYGW